MRKLTRPQVELLTRIGFGSAIVRTQDKRHLPLVLRPDGSTLVISGNELRTLRSLRSLGCVPVLKVNTARRALFQLHGVHPSEYERFAMSPDGKHPDDLTDDECSELMYLFRVVRVGNDEPGEKERLSELLCRHERQRERTAANAPK